MDFNCNLAKNKGLCRAECCGCCPLPIETVEKNAILIQAPIIEKINIRGDIYNFTEDGQCIFLNRKTLECVIYKERPMVCKSYGVIPELPCPFLKPNGNLRSPAGIRATQRRINKDVDNTMQSLKKKLNKFK